MTKYSYYRQYVKLCHEEWFPSCSILQLWSIVKFEKNPWDLWKTQLKFKVSLVTSAGTAEGPKIWGAQ